MKRRLFQVGAASSAIVFILVVLLWIRSYWRVDVVEFGPTVLSWDGSFLLLWDGHFPNAMPAYSRADPYMVKLGARGMWTFGLGTTSPNRGMWMGFPMWVVAVLAAVVPTLWLTRRRRRHDEEDALCGACGYDLRGTAGDACPECGADCKKALQNEKSSSRR